MDGNDISALVLGFGLGAITLLLLLSLFGNEPISDTLLSRICQEVHGPEYVFDEVNRMQEPYIVCKYQQPPPFTEKKTVGQN